MRILSRTYPQPDSPAPNLGARERALAVFKYLLDLEPEVAKDHPLFACIVHAFDQHAAAEYYPSDLESSLVPMLTTETPVLTHTYLAQIEAEPLIEPDGGL
jgi:hypothetical protein